MSRVVPIVLALVCPLAACGGGAHPTTVADFGADFLDAVCQYRVRCDQMPDVAACIDALPSDGCPDLDADITGGILSYDADKAGACIDAVAGADCTAGGLKGALADHEADCAGVFSGTLDYPGGCGGGACELPSTRAAIGSGCQDSIDCVAGAFCDALTCAAQHGQDGACVGDDECSGGLVCVTNPATGAGTCGTPPADGENCGFAPPACESVTSFCQFADMTCQPRAGLNESCATAACVEEASCQQGTCVALSGLGDSCESDGDCLGDLNCDTVCMAPAGRCTALDLYFQYVKP